MEFVESFQPLRWNRDPADRGPPGIGRCAITVEIRSAGREHLQLAGQPFDAVLGSVVVRGVTCLNRIDAGPADAFQRRPRCAVLEVRGGRDATEPAHEEYGECLEELISALHSLVNVYPVARLHDCESTSGETPQVVLNQTVLGTY